MSGSQSLIFGTVMVLAGIGIPVMAALNGGLGTRLGNPVQAATLLFLLALTVSAVVMLVQPKPITINMLAVPPHYFLGGLFVAFYVLAVTFIGPKIGVGNAIVLVLLGQTLASVVIDHFGWFGAQQVTLNLSRAMGCVFIVGGVLFARRTVDV